MELKQKASPDTSPHCTHQTAYFAATSAVAYLSAQAFNPCQSVGQAGVLIQQCLLQPYPLQRLPQILSLSQTPPSHLAQEALIGCYALNSSHRHQHLCTASVGAPQWLA